MAGQSQIPDESTFEASVEAANENGNGDYITLEPNWENVALWFAQGLAFHDFEKSNKAPIITFIETIRYLSSADPEAVKRIIEKLRS